MELKAHWKKDSKILLRSFKNIRKTMSGAGDFMTVDFWAKREKVRKIPSLKMNVVKKRCENDPQGIWSIRPLSKNTYLFVFNTDLMIVDSGDGDSLILMF